MRRVVITGVGVISPVGVGAKAFFENLCAGQTGVRRTALFEPSGFACQVSGEIPPYKISEYVPKSYRKATKVMARDIELAVIAADDAFKDAGLQSKAYTDAPSIDVKRFGCNIGAGLISTDLNELTAAMHTARNGNQLDLTAWGNAGMNQLTPLWLLKYLPNMLACHVTIIHGLMGPSNTITCAEASSHLAIGEAFRTIQRGSADMAICGGAEAKVTPMGTIRHTLLNRLTTTSNATPESALRPFDANASGTVHGEGGGLFILEEYEHAKARGAKIYGELVGFGASQDTYSVTDPDPSGHSYSKAIDKALADAKLTAADVDLIVPNGLGIASFDQSEYAGLQKSFGAKLADIYASPIKAQIGNLAAGGGVDAAAALLAVHHGKVPPAINTTKLQSGIKLNVAPTVRDAKLNVAVSTVYSLGGQNAALVFKAI